MNKKLRVTFRTVTILIFALVPLAMALAEKVTTSI